MAVNKKVDDNARKGAVRKSTQLKTTLTALQHGSSAANSLGSSGPSRNPRQRKRLQKNSKAFVKRSDPSACFKQWEKETILC